MTLAGLLTSTCVITRRTAGTALDSDGNQVKTTTAGTVDCSLQQAHRQEPVGEGEFSVTTWDVYLPTGTAINTKDKVTVDGVDFEVIGDPWDATEGSSAVHHVEATVKRTV